MTDCIHYTAPACEDISLTAAKIVTTANDCGVKVVADFNGIALIAEPGDLSEKIVTAYYAGMARRESEKRETRVSAVQNLAFLIGYSQSRLSIEQLACSIDSLRVLAGAACVPDETVGEALRPYLRNPLHSDTQIYQG